MSNVHLDLVLFDKRKKRVGTIGEITGMRKEVTINWSDGERESRLLVTHLSKLPYSRYKKIRLRDFPIALPYHQYATRHGNATIPARLRKDEFSVDNGACKFIRLLDVIAIVPLDTQYITTHLIDFLPKEVSEISCDQKIAKLLLRKLTEAQFDQFIIDCTLDRTNHSIYRVRIATFFTIPTP